MENVFKNINQFDISEANQDRIKLEIEEKLPSLPQGIYSKVKVFDRACYIKIIVDTKIIGINTEEIKNKVKNIPECITFLVIVDYSFPNNPPKILSKSDFCFPNLMDGRNLTKEIIPNWRKELTIYDVAISIPIFIKRVLLSNSYKFYGNFSIGAVYDLTNYNNLLVNTFTCKMDYSQLEIKADEKNDRLEKAKNQNYTLILSDDCFILFENVNNNPKIGRVSFWSTLFAITDIQINKTNRIICINFYSDEKQIDKQLRLVMVNLLFFKEALMKRMLKLKIKIEKQKLIKGHWQEKRLSSKDINKMTIDQIEQYLKFLKTKIEHNEINFYVIDCYSILCRKAVEYYSANDSEKHNDYLSEMKQFLLRDDVKEIINKNNS